MTHDPSVSDDPSTALKAGGDASPKRLGRRGQRGSPAYMGLPGNRGPIPFAPPAV